MVCEKGIQILLTTVGAFAAFGLMTVAIGTDYWLYSRALICNSTANVTQDDPHNKDKKDPGALTHSGLWRICCLEGKKKNVVEEIWDGWRWCLYWFMWGTFWLWLSSCLQGKTPISIIFQPVRIWPDRLASLGGRSSSYRCGLAVTKVKLYQYEASYFSGLVPPVMKKSDWAVLIVTDAFKVVLKVVFLLWWVSGRHINWSTEWKCT